MKKRSRILFFLIGLAGIFLLIVTSDFSTVDWSLFLNGRFLELFLLLLALWFVIYANHVNVYKVILGKDKKKIGFFNLLGICVSGFALNNVTPAGLLGGEPYRIIELKRFVGSEKATSSSFTFTIVYIASSFLLWAVEGIVYLLLGFPGELFSDIIVSIMALLSATAVLLLLFSRKFRLIKQVLLILAKLPFVGKYFKKLYLKNCSQIARTDRQIMEFRKQRGKLEKTLFLEFISRLLEGLEYYLILSFLGLDISLITGIMIMANASMMGNILFFIPMQIGSRESGMTIAMSWFGLNTSMGIPACIIYRLRDITCTIIGVFCILINKRKNEKETRV